MPLKTCKRNIDIVDFFIILSIIISLILYLINVKSINTSFADEWVLKGIFVEFTALMLLLIILSFILFNDIISSSLFFNIIMITLIIFTPLLKYVNAISLASRYDALAHYSFALWIVRHSHVAPLDKLYYSSVLGGGYVFHPGNGLTPAILHIVTAITLDYSMNVVLLLNYIGYVTFMLLILAKIISKEGSLYSSFHSNVTYFFMLFLVITTLISVIYFCPAFSGTFIAYLYTAFLFYCIMTYVTEMGSFCTLNKRISIIAFLIVYLALLLTHFSTAIIVTFYFGLLIILSLKINVLKISSTLKTAIVISIFAFLTYEFFYDVLLVHSGITNAIKMIATMYLRELKEGAEAIERHKDISLIDLVRYFVATQTKITYIGIIVFLCLVISLLLVVRTLNDKAVIALNIRALVILFLSSLVMYIPGYSGVGSLEGGIVRMLPLLQIPLITTTFYFFTIFIQKLPRKLFRNFLAFLLSLLIILGYMFNYNLVPLAPTMRYYGEEYRFSGFIPISIYDYNAIHFVAIFGTGTIKFITLSPFTTFGYADLLWNTSKIPRHGFISLSPDPDEATEMIKSLVNQVKSGVIPLYLTDRLSGRIGLKSYYEKLFEILESETSMIYNNKYYALFLSI
jgi:hypothetical protein